MPSPRDVLSAAFARMKARTPTPIQTVLETTAREAACPPG
jgi:hypothetical protein